MLTFNSFFPLKSLSIPILDTRYLQDVSLHVLIIAVSIVPITIKLLRYTALSRPSAGLTLSPVCVPFYIWVLGHCHTWRDEYLQSGMYFVIAVSVFPTTIKLHSPLLALCWAVPSLCTILHLGFMTLSYLRDVYLHSGMYLLLQLVSSQSPSNCTATQPSPGPLLGSLCPQLVYHTGQPSTQLYSPAT